MSIPRASSLNPPQLVDTVVTYPSPAYARIAVAGDLDLATAAQLRNVLLGVLHSNHPAVLDIDLRAVSFMDCAAVTALISVRTAALQRTCLMRLSHPQPIVTRVLEITQLLELFTNPTEALRPETGSKVQPALAAAP